MTERPLLVVNAGSSSIKTAVFDAQLREVLRIEATGIGSPGQGRLRDGAQPQSALDLPDHTAALTAVLDHMAAQGHTAAGFAAVGHRVVHGGPTLSAPCRITPKVRAQIAEAAALAPLHNPHHLAGIDAVAALMPDLPQFACFDTGFHATNPPLARRYALPDIEATGGVQRYGFHGISYAALASEFETQTGAPLPSRLLALHLGNGASLCAIKDGQSVATTMGFSPLNGLTMGTRAGEIDAGAVLYLVRRLGLDAAEDLLQHRSGLLGLSGEAADMRDLSLSDSSAARFARDHFCYWIARQAGSMIAAMGGIDGIAFTGGIGENDAEVRNNVLEHLAWAGNIPSWIVAAAEERHIARASLTLLTEPEAETP